MATQGQRTRSSKPLNAGSIGPTNHTKQSATTRRCRRLSLEVHPGLVPVIMAAKQLNGSEGGKAQSTARARVAVSCAIETAELRTDLPSVPLAGGCRQSISRRSGRGTRLHAPGAPRLRRERGETAFHKHRSRKQASSQAEQLTYQYTEQLTYQYTGVRLLVSHPVVSLRTVFFSVGLEDVVSFVSQSVSPVFHFCFSVGCTHLHISFRFICGLSLFWSYSQSVLRWEGIAFLGFVRIPFD